MTASSVPVVSGRPSWAGGHTALWSGPDSTRRSTTTRAAATACPAASATAGRRSDGSGLSPTLRLKSASASYGTAAAPKESRSATLTTPRRIGWKARATRAVASSEGQKPVVP